MTAETSDDLKVLKTELQGNYTKYFKEAFQDNNFEKKWKTLFDIRNKVAHNNLFILNDYNTTKQVVDDLTDIISEAENKIDTFKFSVEEQEAIRQATIEAVKAAELQSEPKEKALEKLGIKVVGKIELPEEDDQYDDDNPFRIITEEDLLRELDYAEKSAIRRHLSYVGLKNFVTKLLGAKGFAFGPSYSLVNILHERGIVEIYEADDDTNYFQPKAIRRKVM